MANKTKSNLGIKQGDKVRVSKGAPKLIFGSCDMSQIVCTVCCVDKDVAAINMINDERTKMKVWIVPTKYLVKVDAETKEAKFKIGDIVTHKNSPHIWRCVTAIMPDGTYVLDGEIYDVEESDLVLYTEPTAPTIKVGDRVRNIESGLIGFVDKIVYGNIAWVNGVDGKRYHWKSDELELVEPTEQTEAKEAARIRQMEVELDEFRKEEIDRVLHPEKYYTYEVTIDNVAMNWQRYEADLAKELAISYAKRGENPLDAVADAKEITKRLKQK